MSRQSLPQRQIEELQRLQTGLTRVLVGVAVVALAFTATNVTLFAIDHHIHPAIAWLLDPMVAVALGAVLIVDGRLAEHGVRPSGWATVLRWFAGLGTWLMNCWASLWPAGSPFGMPRDIDPAGLVLHSIPPLLLILLAEAITFYRRAILKRIDVLRVQVDTGHTAVNAPQAQPLFTPDDRPRPKPVEVPSQNALPLVICGGREVYAPSVPPLSTVNSSEAEPEPRLSTQEAFEAIRECWVNGVSIRDAARKSTRSTTHVHNVYQRLAKEGEGPSLIAVGGG
ncbi:hypothetical protein [Streptomyces sp. NBC_01304]|uniref:hypothetical protein n=1 Tax=Streptomyces sp. NBC_01304 TaxID=2903818 RepID=UPI002E1393EB|nr:hypothetical protein OG430_25995 [Streptomyces sp. NBC_01304]